MRKKVILIAFLFHLYAYSAENLNGNQFELNLLSDVRYYDVNKDSLMNKNNCFGLYDRQFHSEVNPFAQLTLFDFMFKADARIQNDTYFLNNTRKNKPGYQIDQLYFTRNISESFFIDAGKKQFAITDAFVDVIVDPYAKFIDRINEGVWSASAKYFIGDFDLCLVYIPAKFKFNKSEFENQNTEQVLQFINHFIYSGLDVTLIGQINAEMPKASPYIGLSSTYIPEWLTPDIKISLDSVLLEDVACYRLRQYTYPVTMYYLSESNKKYQSFAASLLGLSYMFNMNAELKLNLVINRFAISQGSEHSVFDALENDPYFVYSFLPAYNQIPYLLSKYYIDLIFSLYNIKDKFNLYSSLKINMSDWSRAVYLRSEFFPYGTSGPLSMKLDLSAPLFNRSHSEYGNYFYNYFAIFSLKYTFNW